MYHGHLRLKMANFQLSQGYLIPLVGIAKDIGKKKEFIKFVKVAPCILHSIIPKQQYDYFVLLHRIYQFLFSMPLRVERWEEEVVSVLEGLLWLRAIKYAVKL